MISISQNITIHKSIEKIIVTPDYASAIGMIIVELITNSIKYAFNGKEKGIISLKLNKKSSKIILTIEDNGCGLPKDFEFKEVKSMGFHLVTSFVAQLR